MPINRLHPLDSLFRAATRLGRNAGSNATTAGDSATTITAAPSCGTTTTTTTPAPPSRVTYRPFTSEVRRGIEHWISDTSQAITSASPSGMRATADYSAACYAPLAAEVVENAASISSEEDEDEDEDEVSSPFLKMPPSCSTGLVSSKGEDEDEDEEQFTRGRSRTRRGEYGYITIAPPLPALTREDAFVEMPVSPVSSGSRSSSRVSALSVYEEEEQEGLWEGAEEEEEDEDEEGGCEIRITPPSMGSECGWWESERGRDEEGEGEEIEVEIMLQ
ncbi:hypothetical protein F4775DRAFT_587498 [Biscogniauxia sp. FL1348]|nr:hypothetical protein F4775DRAFT_587498 [Biscogniauxia sp. FL1348]